MVAGMLAGADPSLLLLLVSMITLLPAQRAVEAMPFVRISPGEFMMGCSTADNECNDGEKPAHRIRITKTFEIGKYEVTQAEWESVMGTNPSMFKGPSRPVENISSFEF